MKIVARLFLSSFLISIIWSSMLWAAENNAQSTISGQASIKLNVGSINNILSNTTNSQGRVNVGTIRNSFIKNADINLNIKNINNKIIGGNNNRGIVNVGSIKNSFINGKARIDIRATGDISNTISGGNHNRAEVSIGCIGCDDDDDYYDVDKKSPNYTARIKINSEENSAKRPVLLSNSASQSINKTSTTVTVTNKNKMASGKPDTNDTKIWDRWNRTYSGNPTFFNRMNLIARRGGRKHMLEYIRMIEAGLAKIKKENGDSEYRRVNYNLFIKFGDQRRSSMFNHKFDRPSWPIILGKSVIAANVTAAAIVGYYYSGIVRFAKFLYEVEGQASLSKDIEELVELKKILDAALKDLRKIKPKTFSIDSLYKYDSSRVDYFFNSIITQKTTKDKIKTRKMEELRLSILREFERAGATNNIFIRKTIQAQVRLLLNSKHFIKYLGTKKRKLYGLKAKFKSYILDEMSKLAVLNTFDVLRKLNIVKDVAVFKKTKNRDVNLYVRLISGEWIPMHVAGSRSKEFKQVKDQNAIADLRSYLSTGDVNNRKLAEKIWNQQAAYRNNKDPKSKIPNFDQLVNTDFNKPLFGRGLIFQITEADSKAPQVNIVDWDATATKVITDYNQKLSGRGGKHK